MAGQRVVVGGVSPSLTDPSEGRTLSPASTASNWGKDREQLPLRSGERIILLNYCLTNKNSISASSSNRTQNIS